MISDLILVDVLARLPKAKWSIGSLDSGRDEISAPATVEYGPISAFLSSVATKKPQDCNAEQVYRWALQLDPNNFEAIGRLGQIELGRSNNEKALEYFERCLALRKDPVLYVNAASALHRMGWLDKAETYCYDALLLKLDCRWAYILLATLHEERGDLGSAVAALNTGIDCCPDDAELKFHRGLMNLKRGHWEAGWADHEFRPSRLELIEKIDGQVPEWRGEDLTRKTLLVCGEQGIGDQIQFSRYLEQEVFGVDGANIVLFTRPELARLFAGAKLVDRVITSDRELEKIDVDYWIGICSLPHVLALHEPLPVENGFHVQDSDVLRFSHLIPQDGNLRVGLVWAGNPKHRRDKERSLHFDQLAPLLDVENCTFYAFQHGEPSLQNMRVRDISAYCHDLMDVTIGMRNLDLLITVDTAAAHLAGTLGVRCLLLSYEPCDWRWGAGNTTAWYDSVTILRQRVKGNWDGVIADARKRLADIVDQADPLCLPALPKKLSPLATRDCRYGKMTFLRNDHYVGRAIDLYGEYSQSEADLLRALLKKGDVVVEAGANIGGLTVALADIVGKDGTVFAFEPQSAYCQLLVKNCPKPNVIALNLALGEHAQLVTMQSVETEKVHAPGWAAEGAEFEIPIATIDHMMEVRNPHVALIKVDCDGPEHSILKGAEKTIDRCRPWLYFEFDKPECYPDMLRWVKAKGYRLWKHEAPLFNPENFASNNVNVFGSIVSLMILAVPMERKLDPEVIRQFELQPVIGAA